MTATLNHIPAQAYPQTCPAMLDHCPVCRRKSLALVVDGGVLVGYHTDGIGEKCPMTSRLLPEDVAA